MAARVVIVSQFVRIMVPWTEKGINGVTSASPLMQSLDKISASTYWNLFLGNRTGSIGETSVIALLLGAAYLFYRRTINGWIPAVYLLSVIATSLLLGRDPLFDLMSGAVIITAFFVATDPVTSPATKWGRIIFATGIGVITVGIRFTNLFATGEALGIVMMNLTVPFLDKIFPPRVYGTKRKLQINLD
jgi:H+/Na+-translocating ferredoxin:NAD+ oxidoreductase subunit D